MLDVDIEKILPVTAVRDSLNKIIDEVEETNSLYVVTKNGKPAAIIVGVSHLEKLTGLSHKELMPENLAPEMPAASTASTTNAQAATDASTQTNTTDDAAAAVASEPQAPAVSTPMSDTIDTMPVAGSVIAPTDTSTTGEIVQQTPNNAMQTASSPQLATGDIASDLFGPTEDDEVSNSQPEVTAQPQAPIMQTPISDSANTMPNITNNAVAPAVPAQTPSAMPAADNSTQIQNTPPAAPTQM